LPATEAQTAARVSLANPVLVEVTRGPRVESRHRGAAAVADTGGKLVAAWGQVEEAVYPRSAIKPLQALAVIETGAAEAFAMSESEIALACASHSGQPIHTEAVAAWLARIGLGVGDLECGAHPPSHPPSAAALIRAGLAPSAAHNNCSGKHTSMLTAARHRGERLRGYIMADHPVQQRWLATVGEICGTDLSRAPMGIDGCSIPTVAIPLTAMARGMARLADPSALSTGRAEACRRIARAMAARPELVAGSGRFSTVVMTGTGGRVLLKEGAEGVYCAALPSLGLGIALKIEDGAGRAAEAAMAAVLRYLGALDEADWGRLSDSLEPGLRNWNGFAVGEIRAAPGWAG
jgi:L-asparaginase II